VSVEEQEAELEGAEAAMWACYLAWSKIARVAIKQRVLLRRWVSSTPAEAKRKKSADALPEVRVSA